VFVVFVMTVSAAEQRWTGDHHSIFRHRQTVNLKDITFSELMLPQSIGDSAPVAPAVGNRPPSGAVAPVAAARGFRHQRTAFAQQRRGWVRMIKHSPDHHPPSAGPLKNPRRALTPSKLAMVATTISR